MLDPNSNIPEISKKNSLNELKTTAVCSEILKVSHVNCQRDCDERKRDGGRLAVIQLPLSRSGKIFALLTDLKF